GSRPTVMRGNLNCEGDAVVFEGGCQCAAGAGSYDPVGGQAGPLLECANRRDVGVAAAVEAEGFQGVEDAVLRAQVDGAVARVIDRSASACFVETPRNLLPAWRVVTALDSLL